MLVAPTPATAFEGAPACKRSRKMLPVGTATQASLSLDVRAEGGAVAQTGAEVIDDVVWGRCVIHEPELVALLRHESVQRLHTVLQHGITGLLGMTCSPPVTRYEHSVGAMLVVRRLGGTVEAQAAALLHDVAHTALSHVIDSTFGYVVHEEDKDEFLAMGTLRQTLAQHFADPDRVLEEHLFPLLERDAPKLCADRLDYGLRDSVAFHLLSRDHAHAIRDDLVAFNGEIAMKSADKARLLALAYMSSDRAAWSNATHSVLYELAAKAIRIALDRRVIVKADIWRHGDASFWRLLTDSTDVEVRSAAARVVSDIHVTELEADDTIIESDRCFEYRCARIKVRVIDPDIITAWDAVGAPIASRRLSELDASYADRMRAYVASKSGAKRYRVVWSAPI